MQLLKYFLKLYWISFLIFSLSNFSVAQIKGDSLNNQIYTDSSTQAGQHPINTSFELINTAFENASPLNWEVDADGAIIIGLTYDHERSSTNRATGHWYFQIQAKPGSDLTLVLKNFDNIWNGKEAKPVSDDTHCYVSYDRKNWKTIPTKMTSDNSLKFHVHMEQNSLYVARLEPYHLGHLEKLITEIQDNPLVDITPIGKTVEGRQLEIIRVGKSDAPHRIFIRARAHAWEPGGNWVVQGLIRSLLQENKDTERYLEKYCLYILPMANKDAVARGRTRFNSQGMDLNRNWDKPADPVYAPENHSLESWLEDMIKKDKKPHLAIDLHNDRGGNLHISRPNVDLEKYLANMNRFETLLYKHTWFTEGSTGKNFRNPGTIGEGLVERYGIDAFVYELNCEWIAGLNKVPFGKDWELLGKQLREVFFDYFTEEQ